MLAVQLDLEQEAAAPRHGGTPLLCIEVWGSQHPPGMSPFLGRGRKVTRGWFFIPTHSNTGAMKMLAPEYAFQNLSPKALALYTWGHCPYLLCPCPSCRGRTWPPNTLILWPAAVSANSCMIQNNLAIVHPQNIHRGIKWSFLWSHCHTAEEAPVLLIPRPGAGHEDPVVAARILQQSQPSEMSFQPWLLLDLVEGELLQSLDPTELISHQGQGLVLSC